MRSNRGVNFATILILLFIFNAAHGGREMLGGFKAQKVGAGPVTMKMTGMKFGAALPIPTDASRTSSVAFQGGENIASAVPISSIPVTLTGTTAGHLNDYDVQCPNASNSPDVVYSYTPAAGQYVHITSCNSSYWTKLFVYENSATTVVACNQYSDSCLPQYRAAIYNLLLSAGNTYYIVVDGWGGQSGNYDLKIEVRPPIDTVLQHPGLADNGKGLLVLGHEYYEYDSLVFWRSSTDDGATWSDATYWNFNGGAASYPSTDYWGNNSVFYGTLIPPHEFNNGAPNYLITMWDGADPVSYEGSYWNWGTYGWHDMKMADIACVAVKDSSWKWGMESMIHSTTYTKPAMVDAPHIFYPTDPEGFATISWYEDLDNCNSTTCDIDRATQKAYAVYDHYNDSLNLWELFCRQDDAANWDETVFAAGYTFLMDDSSHIQYPAITAYDGAVVIVTENWVPGSEADKDIICWYTPDGDLGNLGLSLVAGSTEAERFPRIQHISGQTFVCTYIMDNELYAILTDDGGASWGTPEVVSVPGDSVVNEYRTVDIAESDGFLVKIVYEYHVPGMGKGNGAIHLRLTDYRAVDFICGDGNANGRLDLLDICLLYVYLYRGGRAPVPLESGDVNGDGVMNLEDVLYLINYIYKVGAPLNCP